MNLQLVILLSLALASAVCAVVAAIRISVELEKRGRRTPFPLFRLLVFRNLRLYRSLTLRETGRVGPLFHLYLLGINGMWIFALAAWLTQIS